VSVSEKLGVNCIGEVAWWYGCHSGHSVLMLPVTHPAAFGFRTTDWTDSVRAWLAFEDHSGATDS
jgi:hypothetical protein